MLRQVLVENSGGLKHLVEQRRQKRYLGSVREAEVLKQQRATAALRRGHAIHGRDAVTPRINENAQVGETMESKVARVNFCSIPNMRNDTPTSLHHPHNHKKSAELKAWNAKCIDRRSPRAQ